MKRLVSQGLTRFGKLLSRCALYFALSCLLLLLAACSTPSPGPASAATTPTPTATPSPTPAFPTNSTPLTTYKGQSNNVTDSSWSPDGKRIASASYDKTVQVWEASTGKTLLTYKGQGGPVWSVAWSPDGKCIASGTGAQGHHSPDPTNNSVKVWDATTGQTIVTYKEHGDDNAVFSVTWSPDGTRIASGGADKIARVWDPMTGKTFLQYTGHTDLILAVAWSPDGKYIASSSTDYTAQIWQPQA